MIACYNISNSLGIEEQEIEESKDEVEERKDAGNINEQQDQEIVEEEKEEVKSENSSESVEASARQVAEGAEDEIDHFLEPLNQPEEAGEDTWDVHGTKTPK